MRARPLASVAAIRGWFLSEDDGAAAVPSRRDCHRRVRPRRAPSHAAAVACGYGRVSSSSGPENTVKPFSLLNGDGLRELWPGRLPQLTADG